MEQPEDQQLGERGIPPATPNLRRRELVLADEFGWH